MSDNLSNSSCHRLHDVICTELHMRSISCCPSSLIMLWDSTHELVTHWPSFVTILSSDPAVSGCLDPCILSFQCHHQSAHLLLVPCAPSSLLRAPRSTFRAFLHSGCEDITVILCTQTLFELKERKWHSQYHNIHTFSLMVFRKVWASGRTKCWAYEVLFFDKSMISFEI